MTDKQKQRRISGSVHVFKTKNIAPHKRQHHTNANTTQTPLTESVPVVAGENNISVIQDTEAREPVNNHAKHVIEIEQC
jgi:hypothetical protein